VNTSDPKPDGISAAKREVRERIWSLLDAHGAVRPPGTAGHIPSFVGAERAAERLAELPAWGTAEAIKSNPDRAQLPVRIQALREGKTVYMAVPRLETASPFYLLDPQALAPAADFHVAATGAGAARTAPRVGLGQMRPVDLIVCGSVAVNRRGVRIGKGAGYSDIEVGLLSDAGLRPETVIVTTVHDLQVVDEPIPNDPHDFRVHYIVTPTQVIPCPPSPPPGGIDWELVTVELMAAIPVLAELRPNQTP
jgi:5-formyltetrahydrofolate cyclo-ligase